MGITKPIDQLQGSVIGSRVWVRGRVGHCHGTVVGFHDTVSCVFICDECASILHCRGKRLRQATTIQVHY